MTDEEKKAIEFLKGVCTDDCVSRPFIVEPILNLIEKQSKEIEEYKECERLSKRQLEKQKNDLKTLKIEIEELKEDSCCMTNCVRRDKEKLFLEDKIKAKIEELEEEKEFYNKDEDREWGKYNSWDWINRIINEFQSLLEKE